LPINDQGYVQVPEHVVCLARSNRGHANGVSHDTAGGLHDIFVEDEPLVAFDTADTFKNAGRTF
jgi:hypothetical protein